MAAEFTTTGGTTTISNCLIINNTSSVNGGGIGGIAAVSIVDSTIAGNETLKDGGGIYYQAPWVGGGSLTVTNSFVSQNTADRGGAVFLSSYNSTVNIEHSAIAHNRAESEGGGIFSFAGPS